MRTFAATAAVCCCIWGVGAVEVLDGPEVVDTLLPRVAHIFGATQAVHTTLDDMKLKPEDVYILPQAPNLQDSLSALAGPPLNRQPKPFAKALTMLEFAPYEAAKMQIAEARAAALSASVASVADLTANEYGQSVKLMSIEIVPGHYQSIAYLIIQGLVYAILTPAAIFGLRHAKSAAYLSKTFALATFFLSYSAAAIFIQSVFGASSLIGLPLALAIGLYSMFYALRTAETLPGYQLKAQICSGCEKLAKDPGGYISCLKIYSFCLANLIYHVISGFLQYRFGVVGIFTSNTLTAGVLYTAVIILTGHAIALKTISSDEDPKTTQNKVLAFGCAYTATAGLSFFTNLIAIYGGYGDFVAFDPEVFFAVPMVFDFNLSTVFFTVALLAMWGAGCHEQARMDEGNKNVTSFSTLARPTHEESARALTEALTEISTKGFDM